MIHYFTKPIHEIELPPRFTFPFNYTPHPLCILAAEQVQQYIDGQAAWQCELQKGKMFGVLIVQTPDQQVGFLAAFSGNLDKRNDHPYFVPPVYDLLRPEGYFKIHENEISEINRQIRQYEEDPQYILLKKEWTDALRSRETEIRQAKLDLKEQKIRRDRLRQDGVSDPETQNEMIRQSQFQKAEVKRLEKKWNDTINALQHRKAFFDTALETLKKERKNRSAQLQHWIFSRFSFLNIRKQKKDLNEIFQNTVQRVPPSGAGECAGPKLLQYAFINDLTPLAMAEFWWGDSPVSEIRHHGSYYPACQGKCKPILGHMLDGLTLDADPLLQNVQSIPEPETIYEDEWLVIINKPAGMLSVPGKSDSPSVYDLMKKRYPDATGPMIVHRLDMSTSGLLIVTKHKEVHKIMQARFKERSVRKRYIALLEGTIATTSGIVDLPIRPDLLDRPRQIADPVNGKKALTRYDVLECDGKRTRIALYPLTGRTHQLRVHCAHPLGLNTPICGDELYGRADRRLFLHAESLRFDHPVTGKEIRITTHPDF